MATKVSRWGYDYGSDPEASYPLSGESGGGSSGITGDYVKSVNLSVGTDGTISLSYVDQDGQTHTLTPSWNEKGEQGETGATGAAGAQGETGVTPDISATATVDDTTGTPTVTVTKSGTLEAPNFTFAFSGVKGETGAQGETGATGATGAQGEVGVTPDISATATVDDTTGTPTVTVTKSGTLEAPNFTFAFSGVKGETGAQGEKGETGATGAQGPQGETGPAGAAGSDATVSVTKAISGNVLKQTITSGESNYETDFPADYVTDVTSKDTAITDATETDVENDISGTPQLMSFNISTAVRETEDGLTDASHEIISGVAVQGTDSASSDSYLYFLYKVACESNILYAYYYRQSDNSITKVKLIDFSSLSISVTNEASDTDGVNKVTIGNSAIYILTEPMAITGLEQTSDTSSNVTSTSLKLGGTNQSGEAVSGSVSLDVYTGQSHLATLRLKTENGNETYDVVSIPTGIPFGLNGSTYQAVNVISNSHFRWQKNNGKYPFSDASLYTTHFTNATPHALDIPYVITLPNSPAKAFDYISSVHFYNGENEENIELSSITFSDSSANGVVMYGAYGVTVIGLRFNISSSVYVEATFLCVIKYYTQMNYYLHFVKCLSTYSGSLTLGDYTITDIIIDEGTQITATSSYVPGVVPV